MIGYAMVGTNDLSRACHFYDAVLLPLGLVQVENTGTYVGYAQKQMPDQIEFYVTAPFDQKMAVPGNGAMIAFKVDSKGAIDQFHTIGLHSGGTDEGAPGLRPVDGGIYYAYVRDLDGNKLCAYCADEA